ncbi:hypothetical protein N7478_004989 [Penicillium angulare]|uniref:uncharacterized protein n=1 Tax=Penicillium angulare TaxID=116970 RepID=UPI002540B072|nr:uncharacterized protein N7478_004989 [Penicillium angulare]KAJ5279617.1 hypothetical protein N7478_004989 [Penicillium angulare]
MGTPYGYWSQSHLAPADNLPSIDPLLTPRIHTVQELARTLNKVGVVHVRGTPASGKTILAQFLKTHYVSLNTTVLFFDNWRGRARYELKIMDAGYKQDQRFNVPSFIEVGDYVLIIDDAETSFHDMEFWKGFVLKALQRQYKARICLFSCGGSPLSGTDQESFGHLQSGPFFPRHRVSVLPSAAGDSPPFGLFFTRVEFDDVIRRYCTAAIRNPKICLELSAENRIFEVTRGHPGAVNGILQLLHHVFRDPLMNAGFRLGKDEVESCLNDLEHVGQIPNLQFKSSLPMSSVSHEAIQAMRIVVAKKAIDFDPNDTGIKECYDNGWLLAEAIKGNRARYYDKRERVVCVFPTELHESYFKMAYED